MPDTPLVTYTTQDLLASLDMEMIDDLLFRGKPLPMNLARIYGGQILGQALAAAMRTVDADDDRRPHSLHAYFLRPGDMGRDVIFDVDPIRDGRSFSTRRVVAKQRGRAIFNAAISFQKPEGGLDHAAPLPDVPAPDDLPPAYEAMVDLQRAHGFSTEAARREEANFPASVVDIRTPFMERQVLAEPHPAAFGHWFRYRGEIGDDPVLYRALLAFISDHFFMGTSMLPHGVNWQSHEVFGASLDHSMWFHGGADAGALRVDQWLYYGMESPRAARSRGLNFGHVWTRDGTLICTTAQEGLMRVGEPKAR